MASVTLTFAARRFPWTIAFEPWAEASDVPAKARVQLEIFAFEDIPADNIDIAYGSEGITLGFDSPAFAVSIDDGPAMKYDYSYMLLPHEVP